MNKLRLKLKFKLKSVARADARRAESCRDKELNPPLPTGVVHPAA